MPYYYSAMKTITKFSFIALALILSISSFGQAEVKRQNSTYSFFGLGDLHPKGFSAVRSMGYVGQTARDPFTINATNPASYSAIALSRFTAFETAFDFNGFQVSNSDSEYNTDNIQLSYLGLALPIYKSWGTSIGFVPFSRTNYNVFDSRTQEGIGEETFRYTGTGGFNQFYWGNGVRFGDLSVGANINYIFGTVQKDVFDFLIDVPFVFDVLRRRSITANGVTLDLGFQYQKKLGNIIYTLGASGNVTNSLNTKSNLQWIRQPYNLGDYDGVSNFFVSDSTDAIITTVLENDKITLPTQFAIGISIEDTLQSRFSLAAEVAFTNWESYRQQLEDLSVYKNETKFSFGVMIKPESENSRNAFRRSKYKFGGYYSNGFLRLNETDIISYGFTAGIEMPLNPSSSTRLNLSLDLGQRGTTNKQLIQESYAKVTMGLSFNSLWFVKRKYD